MPAHEPMLDAELRRVLGGDLGGNNATAGHYDGIDVSRYRVVLAGSVLENFQFPRPNVTARVHYRAEVREHGQQITLTKPIHADSVYLLWLDTTSQKMI